MFVAGGIIIILTVVAILKRYEVRLVLLLAGFLMALLGGNPLAAVSAFTSAATSAALVPVITLAMGFAFVLAFTGCDKHLVYMLIRPLAKLQIALVPGAVIVTALINVAIVSAAGVAAAVGAILIPVLIAAGVHPVMAASAVMAGTFGAAMGPGFAHNIWASNAAGVGIMEVVAVSAPKTIISVIIAAISLTVVSIVLKENKGFVNVASDPEKDSVNPEFKLNYLKAFVPVFPLLLIIFGSSAVGILENEITVPQAMLAGVAVATIVARANPQEVTKALFTGMGKAYAEIIGIIIGAMVFTAGMTSIGLTGALIGAMQAADSQSVVGAAAVLGPFLIAVLTGSADAPIIAFNEAVTINAHLFGSDIITLGTLAGIGGVLGRTMSPVVGAAIVCASFAKVNPSIDINPMDLTKRNAFGMIISAIVVILIFA